MGQGGRAHAKPECPPSSEKKYYISGSTIKNINFRANMPNKPVSVHLLS